jgi:hypothetical protein
VAGSCECGNEPSGSIKCGKFIDQLRKCQLPEEGMCCLELISIAQYDTVSFSNFFQFTINN